MKTHKLFPYQCRTLKTIKIVVRKDRVLIHWIRSNLRIDASVEEAVEVIVEDEAVDGREAAATTAVAGVDEDVTRQNLSLCLLGLAVATTLEQPQAKTSKLYSVLFNISTFHSLLLLQSLTVTKRCLVEEAPWSASTHWRPAAISYTFAWP